jgi:hypothetical protein
MVVSEYAKATIVSIKYEEEIQRQTEIDPMA